MKAKPVLVEHGPPCAQRKTSTVPWVGSSASQVIDQTSPRHRRAIEQVGERPDNELIISNEDMMEHQCVHQEEVANKELSESDEVKHNAGVTARCEDRALSSNDHDSRVRTGNVKRTGNSNHNTMQDGKNGRQKGRRGVGIKKRARGLRRATEQVTNKVADKELSESNEAKHNAGVTASCGLERDKDDGETRHSSAAKGEN